MIINNSKYGSIKEKIIGAGKGIGTFFIGIILLFALMLIPALFIVGGAVLSAFLYPWLLKISAVVLAICIFILLPLSVFKKTRAYGGIGIYLSSELFGITTWIWSFLIAYQLWGFIGIFLGILLGGIGVVPIAILATIFSAEWSYLGELILLLLITLGFKFLGIFIIGLSENECDNEIEDKIYEPTSKFQKIKNAIRWILMIPVALTCIFSIHYLITILTFFAGKLAISLNLESDFLYNILLLVKQWLKAFLIPILFITIGSLIAPNHKRRAAIIMSIIYGIIATIAGAVLIINPLGYEYLDYWYIPTIASIVIAIIGVVIGLRWVKRKEQEKFMAKISSKADVMFNGIKEVIDDTVNHFDEKIEARNRDIVKFECFAYLIWFIREERMLPILHRFLLSEEIKKRYVNFSSDDNQKAKDHVNKVISARQDTYKNMLEREGNALRASIVFPRAVSHQTDISLEDAFEILSYLVKNTNRKYDNWKKL